MLTKFVINLVKTRNYKILCFADRSSRCNSCK